MSTEEIKDMAAEMDVPAKDLLVLAPKNDPFYTGRPFEWKAGDWFARLWEEQGFTTGVHLRRVHYRLVSLAEPYLLPDGEPYLNTVRCWQKLEDAGRYARHLGLVAPEAFEDRRNPDPRIFLLEPTGESGEPGWWSYFPDWELPEIPTDLGERLGWELPELHPEGYDYRPDLQPYHVEVWCEKTTMNEELLPVCKRYGVNFVAGAGFQSITAAAKLLGRMRRYGKPSRILFISDYDPAGVNMPVSIARQMEFLIRERGLEVDAKLDPVAVTEEQVVEYGLPRTPIKDEDLRKRNFEALRGEGAVELDAFEALIPGELAAIVERRIRGYWDEDLREEVDEAKHEADRRLLEASEEHFASHAEELREIEEGARAVVDSYRARLGELSEAMRRDLEPYRTRLEAVRHDVQAKLDGLEVDLPELPSGEEVPEKDGWLFDSERDYLDQLEAYQTYQKRKRWWE